jgi:hypothetical protein
MTYTHRGYNCARIPALANYAQAKEHYQSVAPIRGRSPEVRPLGKNRRFTWFTIQEKQTVLPESDDILGTYEVSYALRCWSSDLVEFFSNGDIMIRQSRWHSPTTMGFLTFSLQAIGSIISKRGKWYFQNRAGKVFVMGEEMLLKKGEDGFYQPKELLVERRYRLNRKAINAIRKKYKSFVEYGKNALSIEPTITRLEVAEANHGLSFEDTHLVPYYSWTGEQKDTTNRTKLFQALDSFNQSGDLQMAYELLCYVGQAAGRYSYRTQTLVCEPNWFVNKMDEVIKFQFAKEIFVEEEVNSGVIFHDSNKKYVLGSSK